MTIPIERALRDYRMRYRQWLHNRGPDGGGGVFLRREAGKSIYLTAPEPTPAIDISKPFEVRAAAAVKEQEFKEWQQRNPQVAAELAKKKEAS